MSLDCLWMSAVVFAFALLAGISLGECAPQAQAAKYYGEVLHCPRADTCSVRFKLSDEVMSSARTVKLCDVDAVSMHYREGQFARNILMRWTRESRRVVIKIMSGMRDPSTGDEMAYIFAGKRNLNLRLVREGLAYPGKTTCNKQPGDDSYYGP